ncbi:sensor histidine kinase [Streptantibioticus silvisoli]|uniref:sensor histidine kinase n=1 Tax=Streptantibioticus silvisoli TaxID=2705255 RepID=UPI003F6BAF0F
MTGATMSGYDRTAAREGRGRRIPEVVRAPLGGRMWREMLYVLLGLPIAIACFVYVVAALSVGAGLMITFIGVPLLAGALYGCRAIGVVERARARVLLRVDVAGPEPVRFGRPGPVGWIGGQLKSGPSWRHALYAVLAFPWSLLTFCVVVPLWSAGWSMLAYPAYRWVFPAYAGEPGLQVYGDGHGGGWYLSSWFEVLSTAVVGLVLVLLTPWVVRGLTGVDRLLVTGLLGPSRLATRVTELESDRGIVVDTAAADLRRIERDLHDGAQARLVALAMDLGLAKEKLLEDPETAARMVGDAHGEVKLALAELRDLARGIHPAVLTDRGLDAALSSIAARCTVPVDVLVELPRRPVPAIEGIAYFTVCELLANVSKHSGAKRAGVEVWRSGDRLMLQVRDDGRGGASPDAGSGLAGLAERLDAVDGLLVVDSPAGGPTRITAELPWRV